MKTTYNIGLWGYVCLSDQGTRLHIFCLINYLGVPDVLKYTLCIMFLYVLMSRS